MSTNAEYEVASEPKFDVNSHINSVNAAYLAKKKGRSSKNGHFFSAPIGAYIVNAVDGSRYNYKVGSVDEQRFWTVMVNNGKESAKLFYGSPEQYEQHRGVEVSKEAKDAWNMQQEVLRRESSGVETADLAH